MFRVLSLLSLVASSVSGISVIVNSGGSSCDDTAASKSVIMVGSGACYDVTDNPVGTAGATIKWTCSAATSDATVTMEAYTDKACSAGETTIGSSTSGGCIFDGGSVYYSVDCTDPDSYTGSPSISGTAPTMLGGTAATASAPSCGATYSNVQVGGDCNDISSGYGTSASIKLYCMTADSNSLWHLYGDTSTSTCSTAGPPLVGKGTGCFGINIDCGTVAACFSAASTVMAADGSEVPIADVNVGDKVLSVRPDGSLHFDKVFRITHHDPAARISMVHIVTKAGNTIELSPEHYLHAGACCDPAHLTLARDVKVGDVVFVADIKSAERLVEDEVVSVELKAGEGAFNIHTLSSNVIVNGVAASHFTTSSSWSPSWRSLAPMWYKVVDMMPFAAESAKAAV